MADPLDIKAIREELECTQSELAHLIGVDQSAISKWEKRHTSPRGTVRIMLEQMIRAKRSEASAA